MLYSGLVWQISNYVGTGLERLGLNLAPNIHRVYILFYSCRMPAQFKSQSPFTAPRPVPFQVGVWWSPGGTEMPCLCSQLSDGTTPAEGLSSLGFWMNFLDRSLGMCPFCFPRDIHDSSLALGINCTQVSRAAWAEGLLEKAPGMLSCKSPQQTASRGCISPVLNLFHLEHTSTQKTGN